MEEIKVIIRIDDVTGPQLKDIADFFLSNHLEIPVSIYAMKTQNSWSCADWKFAAALVRKYGWEFGGHTRTHPILPLLEDDTLYDEIVLNVRDIETGFKSYLQPYEVKSFAPPYGEYDDRVIKILGEIGIDIMPIYPDAYPYQLEPKKINGCYTVGVTHTGHPVNIGIYNKRFLSVIEHTGEDKLYILGLHSEWFYPSLSRLMKMLVDVVSRRLNFYEFFRMLSSLVFGNRDPYRLHVLNEHLKFIRSIENVSVKFCTFSSYFNEVID